MPASEGGDGAARSSFLPVPQRLSLAFAVILSLYPHTSAYFTLYHLP